ncbi:hypothetical protein Ahy_B02g060982 [Arachis hypogaea]|uniref:Aminotransferase-like plant mobile domain-containing protein n=1 Tax=Arachis hypogaea TaxID=3818 RepID=A0A445AJZ2_ARAHY|nr:hypothetical protein Ahy_B02g060982 [Arachis hypogaea]
MLSALVKRWRWETHTFVLPLGEVTVTFEDVLHIFVLPIDGEVVTGWTDSSHDFLVTQSLAIFGSEPVVSSSSKSCINLTWVHHIRDTELLDTEKSVQRYIRCHIFSLLGNTLFVDKSTVYAHAKWSHHPRTRAWMSRSATSIRHEIDYMNERPYIDIIIPAELHEHLDVCDTVGPLLSFECIEWHPANRVGRQYGYAQSPPPFACTSHPS